MNAISCLLLLGSVAAVWTAQPPACLEGNVCERPDGAGSEEQSSLLQARSSRNHQRAGGEEQDMDPILQMLQERGYQVPEKPSSSLVAAGPGCPSDFTWGILAGLAQSTFSSVVSQYLPIDMNETFDNRNFTLNGCTAYISGFGKLMGTSMVDGQVGMTLDSLECSEATCAQSNFFLGCTEYNPIVISSSVSSDLIQLDGTFEGIDIKLEGNCSLFNGITNISHEKVTVGFAVTNPKFTGKASVDFVVNPMSISSPQVLSASFDYDEITDVTCTVEGGDVEACAELAASMNNPEFKETLNQGISEAMELINEHLLAPQQPLSLLTMVAAPTAGKKWMLTFVTVVALLFLKDFIERIMDIYAEKR